MGCNVPRLCWRHADLFFMRRVVTTLSDVRCLFHAVSSHHIPWALFSSLGRTILLVTEIMCQLKLPICQNFIWKLEWCRLAANHYVQRQSWSRHWRRILFDAHAFFKIIYFILNVILVLSLLAICVTFVKYFSKAEDIMEQIFWNDIFDI